MTKMVVHKIYIDEDPNLFFEHEQCPECTKYGKSFNLRYMYLNLQEAVYKCSSPDCMFPYKNFKFKNFKDKTVYRYEILSTGEDDSGNESMSWIDSLPISPRKEETKLISKNHEVTRDGLDFLDVASMDTIDRIKNSNAMDQLQNELNEILSSHCSDFVTPEISISRENDVKVEKIQISSQRSSEIKEKPRKLSKCYDFIKQKTMNEPCTSNSPSFKIPAPVKETLNTRKIHPTYDKSPKKHRSPRSKRHTRHVTVNKNVTLESKDVKIESRKDENRSQALSFLNHVEKYNKVDTSVNQPIPVTIEILPQWQLEEEEEVYEETVVVKVEQNFGDNT